jgi:hypothetical protein
VLLYLVSDVLYLKENPFKLKKGGFIFQCEWTKAQYVKIYVCASNTLKQLRTVSKLLIT